MSNAAALAKILRKLADAHYQAADELGSLATEVVAAEQPQRAPAAEERVNPAPVSAGPALPFDDFEEIDTREPQGSLAVCPKHKKAYIEGTYGPYCPSTTDDPAWANKKGYCRITPKNVANYLRMQAA